MCGEKLPLVSFLNPREYPIADKPLLEYSLFKDMLNFVLDEGSSVIVYDSSSSKMEWQDKDAYLALKDVLSKRYGVYH